MASLNKTKSCRLCLNESNPLYNVLEDKVIPEFDVKNAIECLLQMKVREDSVIHWLVCSDCVSKLKEFHNIRQHSLSSMADHRQKINQGKN